MDYIRKDFYFKTNPVFVKEDNENWDDTVKIPAFWKEVIEKLVEYTDTDTWGSFNFCHNNGILLTYYPVEDTTTKEFKKVKYVRKSGGLKLVLRFAGGSIGYGGFEILDNGHCRWWGSSAYCSTAIIEGMRKFNEYMTEKLTRLGWKYQKCWGSYYWVDPKFTEERKIELKPKKVLPLVDKEGIF